MATETPTRRTVVLLTPDHYRRLETAARNRSSAVRRVTVTEVVRSLIDEHLPTCEGQES